MEAFGDIQKKMSSPLLSIPSTLRKSSTHPWTWPAVDVLYVAALWSSGTEGTASSTVAPIIPGATIYSTSSCSQETKISGLLLIVGVSEDFFQLVA